MSFIEELKRRNVFRVGIAYAVSSWVVLQFADLVLENTEAPTWVMDVLFLVVGLGFLVALVVAWAFELTPEGIRREKDIDRSESVTQETGRKLELITLAAAALVLVLFVVDRVGDEPSGGSQTTGIVASDEAAASPETAPGTEQSADGSLNGAAGAESAELELGVAVLPFENLSAEEGNAFFAGGVHEDVLSHISRINDLKVISRTSMMRIAERELDIPEIGRQLGVTHVLEGSVRRAGDQVRVTVQLIDAASDRHLWAENYDRKLDDIFAIQSEIASNIAAQLRTELSPQERARIEEVPTSNLQAYDLFLEARNARRVWRGAAGFEEIRMLLEEAIAIDPDFLDAKVVLASAYGRLVWLRSDPEGIYRVKARELTDQITSAFPDSSQAALARANYRYLVMADYDQALRDYQVLLADDPNNVDLLRDISASFKRLNRHAEGLPVIERAIALDPENPMNETERVFHLLNLDRVDEARAELRRLYEENPDSNAIRSTFAYSQLWFDGDLETWLALVPDRIGTESTTGEGGFSQAEKSLQRRLAVKNGEISRVLTDLEQSRVEGDEWSDLLIDLATAEALNIAGREADSVNAAQRSLDQFEARIAQGKPFAAIAPRYYLTMMAYTACLAAQDEKAVLLLGLATGMDHHDESMKGDTGFLQMKALAECGALDQAWVIALHVNETMLIMSDVSGSSPMLAIDPIYEHYFSELPAWQEMVRPES